MLGAVFVGFKVHSNYCASETHSQTQETIGLISNMFVVVTSLVLGLMLNSAKGTFETHNNNVHALASQIILLGSNHAVAGAGSYGGAQAFASPISSPRSRSRISWKKTPRLAASLEAAGASLRAIHVTDDQKLALWNDARQLYRQVAQQRWVVVDTSGGDDPDPDDCLVGFSGYRPHTPALAIELPTTPSFGFHS